jgi:hypothetical protein
MTGGRIVALIFAILLLLPGGCFLVLGIHMQSAVDPIGRDVGLLLLIIAAVTLSLAGLLLWIAFRRHRGGSPDTRLS